MTQSILKDLDPKKIKVVKNSNSYIYIYIYIHTLVCINKELWNQTKYLIKLKKIIR